MKIHLDVIESRLRMVIEEWIIPFNRVDFQNRLAHQLVEAMRERIFMNEDGHPVAPHQYIIRLNPNLINELQDSNVPHALPETLQNAAREVGVIFNNTPFIRLEPDPTLDIEGIAVRAFNDPVLPGTTAILSLKHADPNSNNRSMTGNAFLIVAGNQIFPLRQTVINIGRRPDNHLVLDDPRVSRAHAQIRYNRGQFILFDLNSSGGTMVNGQRIHQIKLKPGDVISFAGVALIYGEEMTPDEGSSDTTQISSSPPPEKSK